MTAKQLETLKLARERRLKKLKEEKNKGEAQAEDREPMEAQDEEREPREAQAEEQEATQEPAQTENPEPATRKPRVAKQVPKPKATRKPRVPKTKVIEEPESEEEEVVIVRKRKPKKKIRYVYQDEEEEHHVPTHRATMQFPSANNMPMSLPPPSSRPMIFNGVRQNSIMNRLSQYGLN